MDKSFNCACLLLQEKDTFMLFWSILFYLRILTNNFNIKIFRVLMAFTDTCSSLLKNVFEQHFSNTSKRLSKSWDCIPSCTICPEKLNHQSSPRIKQDSLMHSKIFDCCLFHWLAVFSSAEHWVSWDSFSVPEMGTFFIKIMLYYGRY